MTRTAGQIAGESLLGTEAGPPAWCRSSWSIGNGNCVEVACRPGHVAVRDSKDRPGPALLFPAQAWRDFISGIKDGGFQV
jgi:uncharacterized protein DUF397